MLVTSWVTGKHLKLGNHRYACLPDSNVYRAHSIIVQFAKQAERRAPYGGDRGDSYRGDDRRDDRGPPRGGGGRQQGWRLNISNLPPGCSWQVGNPVGTRLSGGS